MDLRGVYPPIPTPFSGVEENIDYAALSNNVDRWLTTGIRGFVVLGSNGEAPLLDDRESDAVITTVRDRVPDSRLVIAGTGRESTKASVAASQRASELGVDAVLVRTPSIFKAQTTDQAFIDHYTTIAEGSQVPIILYNFTALTGVTLSVEVVAALAEHPNIVGIKESGPDIGYVSALVDQTPDDFSVLVGSAPTFYASLMSGAAGGILALAVVVPDECVELFDLVQSFEYERARVLQRRLTPLAKLVTRVHGISGLKAALDLVGYVGGDPRFPLTAANEDVRIELTQAFISLDPELMRRSSLGDLV